MFTPIKPEPASQESVTQDLCALRTAERRFYESNPRYASIQELRQYSSSRLAAGRSGYFYRIEENSSTVTITATAIGQLGKRPFAITTTAGGQVCTETATLPELGTHSDRGTQRWGEAVPDEKCWPCSNSER
jgi:hypothetical protein